MIDEPKLCLTADGSVTLYAPHSGEHYHSMHGALQESQHIFIEHALEYRMRLNTAPTPLKVLEVGFGTGLNALLTLRWSEQTRLPVSYTSLELYPLPPKVYTQLSYQLDEMPHATETLQALHAMPWGVEQCCYSGFKLYKVETSLQSYLGLDCSALEALPHIDGADSWCDVIYFDAFSPEAQPELWEEAIFQRLYQQCASGAVFTTYCAKGEVRRRLQRAGFVVERLPGPPGKREMLRATRPAD